MLLTDNTRCHGERSHDGKPREVCILCEQRSYAPASKSTVILTPARSLIDGEPYCPNRRVSGEQEAE